MEGRSTRRQEGGGVPTPRLPPHSVTMAGVWCEALAERRASARSWWQTAGVDAAEQRGRRVTALIDTEPLEKVRERRRRETRRGQVTRGWETAELS